jgi:Zn-dependent protease
MDSQTIIDGLIYYLELIILLTLHEYGHAWTAWRCGDDTARLQGRVSLNPLVHIDPFGTVVLPLFMIFGSPTLSRFMVGYAKPVPVNPYNFAHPQRDDLLVTLAGPGMNLLLAFLLMALARVGELIQVGDMVQICANMAYLSLILCFFNLIPIPPLDGSQVMRVLTNMSFETYAKLSRFGFIAIILILQIPLVKEVLIGVTKGVFDLLAAIFGMHFV